MKLTLARLLGQRPDSELVNLHDAWVGGTPPEGRGERVRALRTRMHDPVAACAVRSRLDALAARILSALLTAPQQRLELAVLKHEVGRDGGAAGSLRAALAELHGLGLAAAVGENGHEPPERSVWEVPAEVADALRAAAADRPDPGGLLTLHGHLERRFRAPGGNGSGNGNGRPADAGAESSDHARRMYRFLAAEGALVARADALPEDLRRLVQRVVTRHGGVLPVAELEQIGARPEDAPRLRLVLEEAALGTVGELDLERYGIRQRGQVLAVFNEAVLAFLLRSAREQPVKPHSVASFGVDFVSDFSRFASFVGDQHVRFTVRGTIFKTTGKRIAESLIPEPGREFRRREILDLLYRFALAYRMIDRTGERSFRLTHAGHEFLRRPLSDKQRQILDWLIEDRELPGDLAHQLRLRRTTLRYLKRLEPGVWYDAMFLPFVVRNHYLATLAPGADDGLESSSFPVRSSSDLPSLAWHLFTWIRKHLYLLGIVDLGYDESGRASALRLTEIGAELLGMIPGRELEGAGHIVVNPDFEVVLFPEERSHHLVYQLDRFAQRELSDSLYHYRISPASLHRALAEGMRLDEILSFLRRLSRTPLPQNVLFSLESWARSDGLVTLTHDGRLVSDSPEILDRLALHPEIGRLRPERLDPGTLRLHQLVRNEILAGWVADFGVSLRIAS
ncbi:MAG: hypothetical protein EYC70_03405 [Planctomycetota bacterium]|nr:MAG: hypothetical protein EYC70_03405 [Planctomycetota bacterium]